MANPFQPEYLILHDYGRSPGAAPSFNPYHALVSGGRVNYRDPKNPYGAPAPHAYKLNPKSIGLSWGGKVGGMPSKEEFALIKQEFDAIKKQFPNIKVMSHGEAYQQTRGTGQQASRSGRGLEEASWRKYLLENTPYEPGTVAPSGPTPMGQRSLTAYAGVQKTQPSTTGTPQPMPTYKNVGGQQFMGPETAQNSQKLAQMLINQGMEQQPMTHWTQALGKVLMTGSGALRNDMAMRDVREGQAAGNNALASMLMGGDAQAAMTNPYSADSALQYQQQQKIMADRNAAAERLQRIKSEAQNADPMRQLRMEKLRKEIATPSGVGNVPAGYRVKPDGNMEPVPGGPADIKAQQAAAKDAARIESIDAKIGRLEDAATDLKKHPGLNRVVGSVWGNYAPNIPGGEAANFAADLQNLKAQVAGTVIQEMRDASKTGGAVGQITEKEWPLLMNMIASIDEAQSVEQYQERLDQLVDYAKTLRQNLRAAGGSAKPDTSMTTVGPPSAVKEYVYDPATGKVVPK